MYVIDKIVEKTERSIRDWKRGASGERSFPLADYNERDSRRLLPSEFMRQVQELEERGLLRCVWYQRGSALKQVRYRVGDLPEFYRLAGRREKWRRMELLTAFVREFEQGLRTEWIRAWAAALLGQLEDGRVPVLLREWDLCLADAEWEPEKESPIPGQPGRLLAVMRGLDTLQAPVYKRVFSSRFLADCTVEGRLHKASKVFEELCQDQVIALARTYCPEVDKNMDGTEVLIQLGIEEYAQTLALKGPLRIRLGDQELDLAGFRYGAILNSQTLEQALPLADERLRRIVTVENQANYEALAYEEGTLFLFCHGYFTPRERRFLLRLRDGLSHPVDYFHTGDLDYGGVCIFRYIRRRLFPRLRPWQMDAAQYERFRSQAEPLAEETLAKLREMDEPLLAGLIACMLRDGCGIEQENFIGRQRPPFQPYSF